MADVTELGLFSACAIASDGLMEWNRPAVPDAFETSEFYELMLSYRHALITDPVWTYRAFEAVKAFAREAGRHRDG